MGHALYCCSFVPTLGGGTTTAYQIIITFTPSSWSSGSLSCSTYGRSSLLGCITCSGLLDGVLDCLGGIGLCSSASPDKRVVDHWRWWGWRRRWRRITALSAQNPAGPVPRVRPSTTTILTRCRSRLRRRRTIRTLKNPTSIVTTTPYIRTSRCTWTTILTRRRYRLRTVRIRLT